MLYNRKQQRQRGHMRSMASIGDIDLPVLRAAVGRETPVGATCVA